jgi:hypothetical protein
VRQSRAKAAVRESRRRRRRCCHKNIAMHNIVRAGLPTVHVLLLPFVGLGFALVVTAAWMGLVRYGLVKLAEWHFRATGRCRNGEAHLLRGAM